MPPVGFFGIRILLNLTLAGAAPSTPLRKLTVLSQTSLVVVERFLKILEKVLESACILKSQKSVNRALVSVNDKVTETIMSGEVTWDAAMRDA